MNKVPSNLPPRAPYFVNRVKELEKLQGYISDNLWRVALFGEGGIGKTTLALEFAHHLTSSIDYDAIVWADLKKYQLSAAGSIIQEPYLRNTPKKSKKTRVDSVDELIDLIYRVSENKQQGSFFSWRKEHDLDDLIEWLKIKRILLIVDDLDSWEMWGDILYLIGRVPNNSTVIVTSRQSLEASDIPGLAPVYVGSLDLDSCETIVNEFAHQYSLVLSESQIQDIVRFSKGTPLLLVLTMALLDKKTGRRNKKVSSQLVSEVLRKFSSDSAGKFLFNDLYRYLTDEAKDLIVLIAVFYTKFNRKPTLRDLKEYSNYTYSDIEDLINELKTSALINRDINDPDPLDMHPLIQQFSIEANYELSQKYIEEIESEN